MIDQRLKSVTWGRGTPFFLTAPPFFVLPFVPLLYFQFLLLPSKIRCMFHRCYVFVLIWSHLTTGCGDLILRNFSDFIYGV